MKNIFLSFFLVFNFFAVSQKNQNKIAIIQYRLVSSINGYSKKNVILKCSKSKSISKTVADNSKTGIKEDENSNIINVYEKEIDTYQSVDFEKNKVISIDNIKNKNYKIVEDLSKMNWKFVKGGEFKTIDKFICSKATLSFRGRNYTAWYTPYIALPFGPWKFHGLPGLILEIYDTENNYHWTVTKIEFPSNDFIDMDILNIQNTKDIDQKEFVEEIDNQHKSMLAKIMKRLPRGAVLESDSYTREGIELIYDWENKK